MIDPPFASLRGLVSPLWVFAFALLVGLLLAAGAMTMWQYLRFSEASNQVEHTYRVLNTIDDLVARVVDGEAGLRGYLLTRDQRFRRPYDNLRSELEALDADLRTLVADNPEQQRLARRLTDLARQKSDEMAFMLRQFETSQPEDALAALAGGRSRELMDDIRATAADMRAAESSLMAQRAAQVSLARRASLTVAVMTILLAVALAGLGVAVGKAFQHRRTDVERALEARMVAERAEALALSDLAESERLNKGVLDSSGDSIAVLDVEGRVSSMNPSGLRLWEFGAAEDVEGCPWPNLWGTSGALASQSVAEAAAGTQSRFQGPCVTKSGRTLWYDVIVAPLRDSDGRVSRLVCTARDITERKAAEVQLLESEQRFRTLADTLPQIVWSTRADGYYDYFNERWHEYTGMPRPHEPGGELDTSGVGQGWRWKDYLHPQDLEPTLDTWIRSLNTGDPYRVQCRFKRRDGAHRWFMVRALPLRDGDGHVSRWFGTCTDIDDEKRAEDERTELLASERAARSEAERAARMKDEFVSTLSHELRTPLNAIVGWVGVLKQDRSTESLERGIAVIDRNLKRQAQMIDDLLDMSRIISGKLRLEVQPVDLSLVIENAVESVQPAADAKHLRLIVVLGSAAVIQGDAGRLQQVIWNLLTNAVKFTPRGGMVQLSLAKRNSHVHIEVSDTGQGIGPEFLPHVFQRFRQADASSTRRHGGLGLGLAIVKNLVEMHGGSVEAASEGEGKGSTFTVRLPLALSKPDEAGALSDFGDGVPLRFDGILQGLRVLVVDDEPDARELVQRFLENAGAKAMVSGSVDAALDRLQGGELPDLIVSDIGIPDRDGYELMRQVRQMDGGVSTVPAVALTALARVEDRKRALLAGYQAHLAKPVDPTELIAMVASLAGRTGRFSG